jgi:hypothetical protein
MYEIKGRIQSGHKLDLHSKHRKWFGYLERRNSQTTYTFPHLDLT